MCCLQDIHIINNELILSDLASAEKRIGSGKKKTGLAGWNSEAEANIAAALLKESFKLLSDGQPVSVLLPGLSHMELNVMRRLDRLLLGGG